eukprot:Hpha_TRINITY_DN7916_c0_g1::TRINITY_DN7916_c0_g1_i1::g.146177::m.146177/K13348/MPV17; protein Mpv17
MSAVLRLYEKALRRRPNLTNVGMGGALAFAGDSICQFAIEGSSVEEFDPWRLIALTVFGLLYQGGLCANYVYPYYPKMLPRRLKETPLREGMAASSIDNFIHVPFFYLPAYFIGVNTMSGTSLNEALRLMREQYMDTMKLCWLMWVPLQIVTFAAIPARHQGLFVNGCSLVWNIILDFVTQGAKTHDKPNVLPEPEIKI